MNGKDDYASLYPSFIWKLPKYLFGVCLKTTCQICNGTASSLHRNINNCTNGIKNILTVQLVVVTDNSYTSIQTSELALFCQS